MSALADRLLHVFHWPVAHPIRLLLPGMVLLSLVAHLLVAQLVKVAAPSRPGLTPWPAKITIFPGVGEEGSLLLAARDPSWLEPGRFRDRMLPPPKVARRELALRPELPPLLPAPREAVADAWVAALPPVSVRPLFVERGPQPSPPALVPTMARFESGAEGMTEEVLARLRAVSPSEPPSRATEMLVTLAPTGDVRHVWLVRGSGDADLDLAAQLAVQRARFAPGAGARSEVLRINWGPREAAP
jgi:TonB family protein